MAIRVGLEHRTSYRFDRMVGLGPHVIRLRPAPHCRTPIISYSLDVSPEDHFLNWQQDPFGNYLARLVFPEKTDELTITVDLVADLTVINPFDFFVAEEAEHVPFDYEPLLKADLAPYLAPVPSGPLLDALVRSVRTTIPDGIHIVDYLVALNQRVMGEVEYTTRLEPGVQSPDETLEKALGSCRDSGWLLVALLRRLGLAARFVSGYLVQLTADEPSLDGPSGPTADFTDLHAWCEVYVPGAGWIGLDPTSGLFAGEGHLPLCCTPHPSSAAPVTGLVEPSEVAFEFSNTVTRLHEDPRVTLPYSDAQWSAIEALGHEVDARLDADDVRLTIGGEPTFVSIDDMEAPEWTIAADGPHKRGLAWDLTQRLAGHFATAPLFHHGQGKWYPGEPLPRWQMGVWWRADEHPLWAETERLSDPNEPGTATTDDARRLAARLAHRLGVDPTCVLDAWEDPVIQLWEEARRPTGAPPRDLDPTDPALTTEDGRRAALDNLSGRMGAPAGFVLPLHPDHTGGWTTSRWTFRRGRLLLLPGDSPIGLRLPLGSVAWHPPGVVPERSPFEALDPLEPPKPIEAPEAAAIVDQDEEGPRTAICIEARDGRLSVFLPPLERAEDFVALLGALESAVVSLDVSVVVEGYPPPRDPRLRSFVITPDPGVIEVNVAPSSSWPELVSVTETLYHEARLTRLGTEKFDLDGSHSGTGGGNHMTLGGATAADSPILRRPDLLRSLLTYWQHHPSLSYLFSGRFVGPTSQAPRVDEGRDDALDELEIAFAQLDDHAASGDPAPPWLVDRLFRNLLVDVTGNTHRAEFCVDKLFSPDSERGRLGLLELRAFEMPPHPRMALLQALLVRSIVARMWEDPYEHQLVRWGGELHDRFLIADGVAADITEVVDDLSAHGFPFDRAWLDPFLEFRFPRLGFAEVAGIQLELRAGIEPWMVLGEENSAGGATARYVDSSVERLQVEAVGLVPGRHAITCNGEPVPMRPATGPGLARDARVAGVRFRAWQPPSALHPTIGVHSPLVFDVIDLWNGRSIGGCTYHVVHPGGRSYDVFPVNANEAEARRGNRFEARGHTAGTLDPSDVAKIAATTGERYPRTLDLRRATTR